MKKVLLFIFSIGVLSHLNAQLVVENFSYGTSNDTLTNPVIGGSNWVRHSGSGGPLVYNNTSLAYTGYASSGVGGSVSFLNSTASREDANRLVGNYTSGSVYASFLLSISASGGTTGDYHIHFSDSLGSTIGTTFRARMFVKDGSVANTFKIGIAKAGAGSAAAFTSSDYPLNTPVLVVLKYTFNPTVTDTVYAYVFTSGVPATEPSSPTITSTDNSGSDLARIRSIVIRQGTVGTAAGTIDGIRVSNTWTDAPLPVSFKSFTSTRANNSNLLKWTTATETNNSGFEVQRSVNNGKYEVIGFVKGAGNSRQLRNYSFTDAAKLTGNVCYRLRQIDFNGNSELSKSACVNISEEKITTEVFPTPNPFNNSLQLNYATATEGNAHIEVVDMLGKVQLQTTEHVNKGANSIHLNTETLPLGIYFLRVSQGSEVLTKRIVKK